MSVSRGRVKRGCFANPCESQYRDLPSIDGKERASLYAWEDWIRAMIYGMLMFNEGRRSTEGLKAC